jgi:hypothetical protein
VRIPEVLVPFMGGMTFLPFVREGRADTTGLAHTYINTYIHTYIFLKPVASQDTV